MFMFHEFRLLIYIFFLTLRYFVCCINHYFKLWR